MLRLHCSVSELDECLLCQCTCVLFTMSAATSLGMVCAYRTSGSVIQCGSRCLILYKYEVTFCEHVFNDVPCGTIVVVVSTQW